MLLVLRPPSLRLLGPLNCSSGPVRASCCAGASSVLTRAPGRARERLIWPRAVGVEERAGSGLDDLRACRRRERELARGHFLVHAGVGEVEDVLVLLRVDQEHA